MCSLSNFQHLYKEINLQPRSERMDHKILLLLDKPPTQCWQKPCKKSLLCNIRGFEVLRVSFSFAKVHGDQFTVIDILLPFVPTISND